MRKEFSGGRVAASWFGMTERHEKSTTSTPHDAVFKTFLRHPETARDFMEIHLPVSLRQLCDLRTLKLEPGSFIEKICEPIIPMCFGR